MKFKTIHHIGIFLFFSIQLFANIAPEKAMPAFADKPTTITITPNDYDVNCTHPSFLDEWYNHADNYTPNETLPLSIPNSGIGLLQNTFIPFNVHCGPNGEIVQDLTIDLHIQHNDFADLEIWLHTPDSMYLTPIQLVAPGSVTAMHTFTASISTITAFSDIRGTALRHTESTYHEPSIFTTVGTQIPTHLGECWYLEIKDTHSAIGNPAYGGLQIMDVSMQLTAGFPVPYTTAGCCLQSVTLLNESLFDTSCDQSEWNGALVMRVWQATDDANQTTTATQTVALKAPYFDQTELPQDITIECTGQTPESITPSQSGYLQFGCFPILDSQTGVCDVSYAYEDTFLPTCGSTFVLRREWTIVNWCNGVNINHTQFIYIQDSTPPPISEDTIIQTMACNENVVLSDLVSAGLCSGIQTATASYVMGGGAYDASSPDLVTIDITSPASVDFPSGIHEVLIFAQDSCLNIAERVVTITIDSPCCVENIQINDTTIADSTYQASQNLYANGQVPFGGMVVFQAGNSISLEAGFEVVLGAVFEAVIDDCSDNTTAISTE